MELTRAGVRGDLLEDEGTERDEEAETESKQTETWQVWPSWEQRWISGNTENGRILVDTQRGSGTCPHPVRQPDLSALQLHVSRLSSVTPFPSSPHHLSPGQPSSSSPGTPDWFSQSH